MVKDGKEILETGDSHLVMVLHPEDLSHPLPAMVLLQEDLVLHLQDMVLHQVDPSHPLLVIVLHQVDLVHHPQDMALLLEEWDG